MESPEKKKSGISRRGFLRTTLAAGGVAAIVADQGAMLLVNKRAQNGAEESVDLEARRRSITTLSTSDATYKIEYTEHDKMSTPEILEGADALVVELTVDSYNGEMIAGQINSGFPANVPGIDNSVHPYRALLQEALKQEIPIFIVDLNLDKEMLDKEMADLTKAEKLKMIEEILGLYLLQYDGHHAKTTDPTNDPKVISRRKFLTNTLEVATQGTALYLLTPLAEETSGLVASRLQSTTPIEGSIARKIEKEAAVINEKIHPELDTELIQTRSMLMAQKSASVAHMLEKELGRKPQIAIEMGAGHTTLEKDLAMAESDRIQRLSDDLGNKRLGESKIARITPQSLLDGETIISVDILDDPAIAKATSQK